METPNPKCPRCKCYWKPTETDIKTSGLPYRTCLKCRENAKAYRDTNKEAINQQQRDYYERNMTTFNQKQRELYNQNKDYFREKIKCPCGSCVCRDHMRKHIKSLKHREFISNN